MVWVILFALFPIVASAADVSPSTLSQFGPILTGTAALVTALTLAWVNLSKKLDATHNLINSRLDEWKKEAKEAAIAAAVAAHDAGVRSGLAQAALKTDATLEGYIRGKLEAEKQGREVAEALATPAPPSKELPEEHSG
jgi:hypothetical protein